MMTGKIGRAQSLRLICAVCALVVVATAGATGTPDADSVNITTITNTTHPSSAISGRRSNAEWLGEHDGANLVITESDSQNLASTGAVGTLSTAAAERGGNINDLRLGFVNFRRIMASVPQLNDIRSRLEHEFGAEEKALVLAQSELAYLEQQLAKMERGEEYSAFEKQVIAKRRDVARRDAAFRDSFSVRRNEELAKLQKLIADEIILLAKTEGYDVILNDTGVFYVSERADLSSIVIERLKKKASENPS